MKNTHKISSILEKGGLMIEALAMLGLIAVVTPTMYKKSAERALEVEDINTADTIRTYMGAAESYMSAYYGTIMKDMIDNGQDVWTVNSKVLEEYLPYNFQAENALYDYNQPVIKIVRNGNNLTAFAVFPAKADADKGIGQERTARIAALIGANGGFVTDSNADGDNIKARGVGGVWQLSGTDYEKLFGDGNAKEAETYSIVTSSADLINSGSGVGATENSKYLQRTAENGDDWRNTMRTDLYMGGPKDDDPDLSDSNDNNNPHGIYNIDRLIVNSMQQHPGYGLYISGNKVTFNNNTPVETEAGTNVNAYIAGTLEAAAGRFLVAPEEILYKDANDLNKNLFKVDGTTGALEAISGKFKVTGTESVNGQMSYENGVSNFIVDGASGIMTNAGGVKLGENLAALANTTNQQIAIGHLDGIEDKINKANATGYIFNGQINKSGNKRKAEASILSRNIFYATTDDAPIGSYDTHVFIEQNGYKGAPGKAEGKNSSGNDIQPQYDLSKYADNQKPKFPTRVGSNMMVDGLLAAGQLDTQHLRTATFSAGSAKIDDAEKWLTVDADGVNITTPQAKRVNDNYVSADFEGGSAQFFAGQDSANTQIGLEGTDTTFSGSENHRVIVNGGDVDLVGANFKIINAAGDYVFSVRGNNNVETGHNNNYADQPTNKEDNGSEYNAAMHGNILFTSRLERVSGHNPIAQGIGNAQQYLSIGNYSDNAGVNIVSDNPTSNKGQNTLYVDLSQATPSDSNGAAKLTLGNNYVVQNNGTATDKTLDAGTVYIRKGLVAVAPDKNPATQSSDGTADTGSGIISASRFVANNYDSSGARITVPELVSNAALSTYNGSNINRYDTYMVNPAYTSVMNDIKLVTRGGARLSDILPDFITKGIYVATNDKDDGMKVSSFKENGGTNSISVENETGNTSSQNWASPYAGVVPAPQCPPGYGRVVTVMLDSFQVGQAGNLAYDSSSQARIGSKFYVDEDIMQNAGIEGDNNKIAEITPEYKEVMLDKDKEIGATITLTGRLNDEQSFDHTQVNVDSFTGLRMKAVDEVDDSTKRTYVLTAQSDGKPLKPLVFQQSTWLKSLAVPVRNGEETWYMKSGASGANTENAYTRGWAILLGYLYDSSYAKYIKTGSDTDIQLAKNRNDLYWNIFPVLKNTLEAYVTTYCYFDRYNIYGHYNSGYENSIDKYNVLTDIPTSFEPITNSEVNSKAYREKLNDPTMKYNELW